MADNETGKRAYIKHSPPGTFWGPGGPRDYMIDRNLEGANEALRICTKAMAAVDFDDLEKHASEGPQAWPGKMLTVHELYNLHLRAAALLTLSKLATARPFPTRRSRPLLAPSLTTPKGGSTACSSAACRAPRTGPTPRWCKVAFDFCQPCAGHPMRHVYLQTWRTMRHPPLAAQSAKLRSGTRGGAVLTRAMRRVAIFQRNTSAMNVADQWAVGGGRESSGCSSL